LNLAKFREAWQGLKKCPTNSSRLVYSAKLDCQEQFESPLQ